MHIQNIISVIIVLTAAFAYLNHRFIKWPPTIGIMALSLIVSLVLAIAGRMGFLLPNGFLKAVAAIDFKSLLMNFMLSFLLFAGSLHLDLSKMKKEAYTILLLATVGTILSTFIVGGLTYLLLHFFSLQVPFIYCLLFGALISPTDPIAVLAILKAAKIPQSLELKITGESLFNDGIAVVIFTTILEIASSNGTDFSIGKTAGLFFKEAVGGLVFGAAMGYAGFIFLKTIDDYKTEVLITIALVVGGYSAAQLLHISGPLAMVVAGLITGNKVKNETMSNISRDYLEKFWELLDELFNAVLFLLIGLEMLTIKANSTVLLISLITIAIVLLARWLSVILPVGLLKTKFAFEKNAIVMLTWGGLRGGISVALALTLSNAMFRDLFVPITYAIVVFSILVQGLSIGKLYKKTAKTT